MARLRQLYPQNYRASGNISAEFESLIRYLNAAELGNKTLAELLSQLFNKEGVLEGPIELRMDSEHGLQFRFGNYNSSTQSEDGWQTVVSLNEIRGPAGRDIGTIGAPIFHGRVDYVATNGQTAFDYAHAATDSILVYKNGVLQTPGSGSDYITSLIGGSASAGAVIFNSGLAAGDTVSLFKVRSTAITGYSRVDYLTTSAQAVFPFIHDPDTKFLVFLNGLLQREGGAYDYVSNPDTDTVTFTSTVPASNLVSIFTVENVAETAATGMMMEEGFCDPASGLILFSKLTIQDDEIPASKVDGLTELQQAAALIHVDATAPDNPHIGQLWHDTSVTPNQLRFYDGVDWLRTSPSSNLPDFRTVNAGQFLKVNGAGTGLEWSAVDLSGVIPVNQKGAANGVAALDTSGRVPIGQLPQNISRRSMALREEGALSNGTLRVQRLWNERVTVDSVSLRLGGGTAVAQLAVNGVGVGSTFSISVTPTEVKLGQGSNPDTPIDVDATGASKTIDIIITASTGATDLDAVVGCSVVTS